MKRIPLYGGHTRRPSVVGHALVDDEDHERVMAAADPRWTVHSGGYAVTGPAPRQTYMHRLVIGAGPGSVLVDHASGDKLDNRRSNLRVATPTQNLANARKRPRTAGRLPSSRFKGVWWNARAQGWSAMIGANGRRTSLGTFASETDAAAAYDAAAVRIFGEFARPNMPRDTAR